MTKKKRVSTYQMQVHQKAVAEMLDKVQDSIKQINDILEELNNDDDKCIIVDQLGESFEKFGIHIKKKISRNGFIAPTYENINNLNINLNK